MKICNNMIGPQVNNFLSIYNSKMKITLCSFKNKETTNIIQALKQNFNCI